MKLKIKSLEGIESLTIPDMQTTQKRCMLVVDDEPLLLEMLSQLLEKRYVIRVAQSGMQALEIMRDGFNPEVILADQRMPGMSGSQFLAKSAAIAPKAVHVVLTGYTASTSVTCIYF
jgi:CheY-like chemotaxis protein